MFGKSGLTDQMRILAVTIAMMIAVSVIIVAVSIWMLHQTAFKERVVQLQTMVDGQAELIAAVARFDAVHSQEAIEGGAVAATLSQVVDANSKLGGFGKTGEFVLGQRQGDKIHFLMDFRFQGPESRKIIPLNTERAEPMRLALSGKSGWVVGLDYRGEQVLAAYEMIPEIQAGLVAKLDLSEIRAPFINAAVVAASIAIVIILLGTLLVLRVAKPIARRLEETKQRLDLTIRGSGDGLWDYDLASGELWYSERFREMLGFHDEKEFPNVVESWSDILHPDDRNATLQAFTEHLERGAPYDVEYRLKIRDGDYRWFRARGKSLRDRTGRAYRAAGSITDISESRQAAEESRQREQDLQHMIEAAPYALGLSRGKADCNAIDYVNRRFTELFGYVQADVPNVEQWGQMFFPDPGYRAQVMQDWDERMQQSAAQQQLAEPMDVMVRCKNGSERHVELAGVVMGNNHLVMLNDITGRKTAESKMAEAMRIAQDASQSKSDFLANMSHEIRTPMNAIIGLTHLALATDLTARQRDYLEKTHNAAQNLLGIINDILDFSKIEAGKLDMETIDFSLQDVLDNLSEVVAIKIAEKGLEFLIDCPQDVPLNLSGDPLRLGQVLLNLVNNAVKFTEQGQVVVRVAVQQSNDDRITLHFEVIDSGIGMSAEQCGKLFQAFAQADSTTSRKYGGTGLGLSISKRLVEMMGGEISVNSEAGKGSCFYFNASFAQGAVTREKLHVVPATLNDMKVLVVDDNPAAREILSRHMEAFNFNVSEVASGEEAIRELETTPADNPYRLVIMDWKMPGGMDGLEAGRRIKQHPGLTNIPAVIMVSAYGRDELMQQAQASGLEGYLVKPVSDSTLLDSVMRVITGSNLAMGYTRPVSLPDTEAHIKGAHLLLVEDNEINQQVAQELLEKGGISVSIVENGKQAVEAVNAEPFDGVLMDIQMPVMDGYEATREIRKDGRFRDLPIIAMTANAMVSDQEDAIAAGMNDHVAKPIDVKNLFSVLADWITVSEERRTTSEPVAAGQLHDDNIVLPDLPGVDVQAGLSRIAGNKKLYRSLLVKFRDSQCNVVEQVKNALAQGDSKTAERQVHTLKGVAANIGAVEVQEQARQLEAAIKQDETNNGLLDAVRCSLSELMAGLSVLDQPESGASESDQGDIDMNVLGPLLLELKRLIEDADADAIDMLGNIKQQVAGVNSISDMRRLEVLLDEYDFEQALDVLNNILQTLEEISG